MLCQYTDCQVGALEGAGKIVCLPRPVFAGGGTGVLGMALGGLGADVTITDLRDGLPHIERNLQHNAALWAQTGARRPNVREHAWGSDMDWIRDQRFDYVVGADLLYFGGWDLMAIDTREPLLQTLAASISPTSEALLVWVGRHPAREETFVRDAANRFLIRLHTASRTINSGGEGYAWSEVRVDRFDREREIERDSIGNDSSEISLSGCLVEGIPVCLQMWSIEKT